MNTYIEGEPLAFVTTAIENIPEGWRARETYEQSSRDSWSERFELAAPGKDFKLYSTGTLQRVLTRALLEVAPPVSRHGRESPPLKPGDRR